MGLLFADQYSILHFSVGSVAYFWNINFIPALFLHTVFELTENTQMGMKLINDYFESETDLIKSNTLLNSDRIISSSTSDQIKR